MAAYGNTASLDAAQNDLVNARSDGAHTNAAQLRYVGANLVGPIDNGDDAQGPAPLSGDPLLGARADNGGDTYTLALGAGSLAIDAGVACTSAQPTTDQRGRARA